MLNGKLRCFGSLFVGGHAYTASYRLKSSWILNPYSKYETTTISNPNALHAHTTIYSLLRKEGFSVCKLHLER
jgi:hypothetical protein